MYLKTNIPKFNYDWGKNWGLTLNSLVSHLLG